MTNNMIRKFIASLLLVILQHVILFNAHAQLTIEISQGNDKAILMAVVPFSWNGDSILPEDVAEVVSNDLRLSGAFSVLSKDKMLNFPYQEEDVVYKNWELYDMSYLLIGSVIKENDEYIVQYQLFDVIGRKSILKGKVKGPQGQMRSIAHKISDIVYEKITLVPGDFSSQLLYVTHQPKSDNTNESYQLNYADSDGYGVQTIFKSQQPILSPAWSHDQKTVAYVSFELGRSMIFLQDLATGKRTKSVFYKGVNSSPAFSPDDSLLAFVSSKKGSPNIYVKNLKTNKVTELTSRYSIDTEPDWMPDGKSLVFTSNRGGNAQIYQLHLKFLAKGNIKPDSVKRLTFEGKFNARAKVFPSGQALALVHKSNKADRFNIAVLDLKSSRMTMLTSSILEDSPSISPNGQRLIYSIQGKESGELGIITINKKVKLLLPYKKGDVREPVWSKH